MDRSFDLVVIGTGVASKAASRCRAAGWTVAVVDSRPFGGTCALRGCIPKKILVAAAEAVHAARALSNKGVRAGGVATSGSKVLIEDDGGRIIGAHLLGPHADEVINVFALAIRLHARADDLKHVLYAYPTVASDVPYMV